MKRKSSFNRRIKRGIQSGKYKIMAPDEKGIIRLVDKKGAVIAVKKSDTNQPLHISK